MFRILRRSKILGFFYDHDDGQSSFYFKIRILPTTNFSHYFLRAITTHIFHPSSSVHSFDFHSSNDVRKHSSRSFGWPSVLLWSRKHDDVEIETTNTVLHFGASWNVRIGKYIIHLRQIKRKRLNPQTFIIEWSVKNLTIFQRICIFFFSLNLL